MALCNSVVVVKPEIQTVTVASKGVQGPPGFGIPVAGLQNQVLAKKSDADYDLEWRDVDANTVAVTFFDPDVVYDAGDHVAYGTSLYSARATVPVGTLPSDLDFWKDHSNEAALADITLRIDGIEQDLSDLSDRVDAIEATIAITFWDSTLIYLQNARVVYIGNEYVAKVDVPVGTPPTDTTYWRNTDETTEIVEEEYTQTAAINAAFFVSGFNIDVDAATFNANDHLEIYFNGERMAKGRNVVWLSTQSIAFTEYPCVINQDYVVLRRTNKENI